MKVFLFYSNQMKSKKLVSRLVSIGLGVAMVISTPATFAFEWVEDTPVFIFGEQPSSATEHERQPSLEFSESNRSGLSESVDKSSPLKHQISQIDLEILLLKAELALQNSDLKGLQQYLQALEKLDLPAGFQQRFDELKGALDKAKPNQMLKFLGFQQNFEFPMSDPNAVVAVILPMSGRYQQVSQQLYDSLESALDIYGFQGRLLRFDSMAYANVFRLWDDLRHYNPGFIFGPLQKTVIDDWHHLDTDIPTLYFNDIDNTLFAYEKALSPSKFGQVKKLASYIERQQFERVLLVIGPSKKARETADDFKLQSYTLNKKRSIFDFPVDKNLSESFFRALGVADSKNRAKVLSRIVYRPVDYEKRSRQDIDVVVSILNPSEAIQISPLMSFYDLKSTPHLWLPANTLQVHDLTHYQNSFQQTVGVLPEYLYQSYLSQDFEKNQQSGIFYALGQVAVEIANQAQFLSQQDWLIDTSQGQVEANQDGRFYLLPNLFWMDKGKIDPVGVVK